MVWIFFAKCINQTWLEQQRKKLSFSWVNFWANSLVRQQMSDKSVMNCCTNIYSSHRVKPWSFMSQILNQSNYCHRVFLFPPNTATQQGEVLLQHGDQNGSSTSIRDAARVCMCVKGVAGVTSEVKTLLVLCYSTVKKTISPQHLKVPHFAQSTLKIQKAQYWLANLLLIGSHGTRQSASDHPRDSDYT